MHRFLSFLLAIVLTVSLLPMSASAAGMDNFRLSKSNPSTFRDVAANTWYTESVTTVSQLGLMKGDNGRFLPDGSVTLSEAITMAARLHSIYAADGEPFQQGTPWYQVYVDYAMAQGIVKQGEFSDLSRQATRAEMAHIFAAALPAKELAAINTVRQLPDVSSASAYSADIFLLYRAGVLTGNDASGTFTPNAAISRAQAAAIIARMALPSLRRSFSLSVATNESIYPLTVTHTLQTPASVGSIDAYSEYWMQNTTIREDLSGAPALAYSLSISNRTKFSSPPEGYDPDALLEWGKAPGLNVDILHKYGFTGKGATIAYVDQPIGKHALYSKIDLHYTNSSGSSDSMHGPAVLSLLAGDGIGTAPEAEIYYYAHASWKTDQTTHAACLYQIIQQNKTLPEDQRITMVGFSDNIDESEANAQAFRDAVAACEEAGIMVWFCAEYGAASYLPMSDKNNFDNLTQETWQHGNPTLVFVPTAGRTTAANLNGAEYIYWAEGGLSWTMPYVLGLYAIVNEIDPSLTQDDLRALIVETAYTNGSGMRIVDPVNFVAAALRGVGRTSEAQAMEDEVAARQKYIYAVMNTAELNAEDLRAIGSYHADYTDATVLVADASGYASAEELYAVLQADAALRGGTVAGVQIFGTSDMVPAFSVSYQVQMVSGVDSGGTFLTDLFYGNFNNDPARISNGYNVMTHFAQGWDVDMIPDWAVARLPLKKGEFSAFLEKYRSFAAETGLEQLDLVNFSNPIFNQPQHSDDMSAFLNRVSSEYGLLDTPYRLYANLDGDAPVTTKVLGNFSRENLMTENDRGVMELLINSHGQWNNIDQCIFHSGQEQRISFLNMDNINSTLDGNCYYLDCWTCLNGYGMANNLTTTALNGQCVGAFTATTIISNSGVDCRASLSQMKQSNFYYFYYSYLQALHQGMRRSAAFCTAQQAYGEALLADSKQGIRADGNYQFNLYNLLAYHNFGVLEPNSAAMALSSSAGTIAKSGQSVSKPSTQTGSNNGSQSTQLLTDGKPVGNAKKLQWNSTNLLQTGSYTIHSYQVQTLDNGCLRFTIDYTAPEGMRISVFDPPNGNTFMLFLNNTGSSRTSQSFDLKREDVKKAGSITINFYRADNDRFFVFTNTEGL